MHRLALFHGRFLNWSIALAAVLVCSSTLLAQNPGNSGAANGKAAVNSSRRREIGRAGAKDGVGRAGFFRDVGTEDAPERARVRGIFVYLP